MQTHPHYDRAPFLTRAPNHYLPDVSKLSLTHTNTHSARIAYRRVEQVERRILQRLRQTRVVALVKGDQELVGQCRLLAVQKTLFVSKIHETTHTKTKNSKKERGIRNNDREMSFQKSIKIPTTFKYLHPPRYCWQSARNC